jgi:hypothetical protein
LDHFIKKQMWSYENKRATSVKQEL